MKDISDCAHNMRQVRVKHDKNFTTVSNEFIRDRNLSLKGKGLMLTILSLNDEEWDFSIEGICSVLKESKTAIYSAIDELIELGYCEREQYRDETSGKMLPVIYTFYEHKNAKEKPLSENPNADVPNAENVTQLNTIIKETTKKEKNIDANASLSESSSDDEIDYEKLVGFWNKVTKGVWGELRDIKNNRRKMVRARIREHGKRDFMKAIENACKSSYLRSQTWFNFDWMIRPNNFDKVLSGNYNHEQQDILSTAQTASQYEMLDEIGNRYYIQGKTKVIIPQTAPPRPDEFKFWSNTTNSWYQP